MIPFLLSIVGGYLIGDSIKDSQIFADGGGTMEGKKCRCKKSVRFNNSRFYDSMNYYENYTYYCYFDGYNYSVSYEDGRFTPMSKDTFTEYFEIISVAKSERIDLEKYLKKSVVDDINSLSKDELLKRKEILTALYNVSKQKDTDEEGNNIRWANETFDLKCQINLIDFNLKESQKK